MFAITSAFATSIRLLSGFPATVDLQNTSFSRIPRGASVSPEFVTKHAARNGFAASKKHKSKQPRIAVAAAHSNNTGFKLSASRTREFRRIRGLRETCEGRHIRVCWASQSRTALPRKLYLSRSEVQAWRE